VDLDIGAAVVALEFTEVSDTDLVWDTEDTDMDLVWDTEDTDTDLVWDMVDTEDMVSDVVLEDVDSDTVDSMEDTVLVWDADSMVDTEALDADLDLDLLIPILTMPDLFLCSTNATPLGEQTADLVSLDTEIVISLTSKELISPGTTPTLLLTPLLDDARFPVIKTIDNIKIYLSNK
jgi:hypothetical protein